jgi:hypothetical protein
MLQERRSGERRQKARGTPDRRSLENALGKIGLLRERIKAFVAENGAGSVAYFDRAVRDWYGPLEDRVALVRACGNDRALEEAWRIVHAAGYSAAPLVSYVVRYYFGRRVIDERA